MSKKEPDLVDKPKGHFFIKAGGDLFFVIVMKKYDSNLHKAKEKLTAENKKAVVKRLGEFVKKYHYLFTHGDIKDS